MMPCETVVQRRTDLCNPKKSKMTTCTVTPVTPIGWFSDFYVVGDNETIQIVTVDVYTYQCSKCRKIDNCAHTSVVEKYVYKALCKEMDERQSKRDC